MLRVSLAIVGLAVALGSPVLAAGDTRYALLIDAPWQDDHTIEAGRDAGGMLVQSGWHHALFYFPEGVARPASVTGTVMLPVQRPDPVCGETQRTETP